MLEERPSVKNCPRPIVGRTPTVILQKQAYAELLLDKYFKKFACLPAKVIKLYCAYELTRLSVAGNDPT